MNNAIISLCKALGQILSAHYAVYDRETSDLMAALAAYVQKNAK